MLSPSVQVPVSSLLVQSQVHASLPSSVWPSGDNVISNVAVVRLSSSDRDPSNTSLAPVSVPVQGRVIGVIEVVEANDHELVVCTADHILTLVSVADPNEAAKNVEEHRHFIHPPEARRNGRCRDDRFVGCHGVRGRPSMGTRRLLVSAWEIER